MFGTVLAVVLLFKTLKEPTLLGSIVYLVAYLALVFYAMKTYSKEIFKFFRCKKNCFSLYYNFSFYKTGDWNIFNCKNVCIYPNSTYINVIIDRLATIDEDLQKIVDLLNDPEYTFEALKEQLNKIIGYGKKAAGDNGTLLKL